MFQWVLLGLFRWMRWRLSSLFQLAVRCDRKERWQSGRSWTFSDLTAAVFQNVLCRFPGPLWKMSPQNLTFWEKEKEDGKSINKPSRSTIFFCQAACLTVRQSVIQLTTLWQNVSGESYNFGRWETYRKSRSRDEESPAALPNFPAIFHPTVWELLTTLASYFNHSFLLCNYVVM